MTDGNTGEGGFQGVWNRFLSIFNKGKEEVVRSSKVSKARLDLSSLRKERERVFERLGEEIYKRHKENKSTLPALDPFFTEIDIINLKLSSKERELKGLAGEEGAVIEPAEAGIRPERRERPYRPKRKGPYPPREVKQEMAPPTSGEAKVERPEGERRPRKRHYRPKRRPSEVKETKQEG